MTKKTFRIKKTSTADEQYLKVTSKKQEIKINSDRTWKTHHPLANDRL